ncbi:MAG: protein translocase subunit SecD [Verrucomicrobia bacterium]|nr:MAG: protein translocase subunit SecD [Verrucomicrobiota bacterium]
METRNKLKWLLLLVLTGLSLALVTPEHILKFRKPLPSDKKPITLGLDLVGGLRYVFEVDATKLGGHSVKDAQARAMEVIRNRVDAMGTTEPNIQAEGDDRIIVELPNLQASDQERALDVLQSIAFLEFRMVHPKNSELIRQLFERDQVPPGFSLAVVEDPNQPGQSHDYLRRDYTKDVPGTTNTEATVREQIATFHAPPGHELLLEKHIIAGQTYYEPAFVNKTPELKGENLKSAGYEYDQLNRPYVTLELDSSAKKKFWNLTKRYAEHGSENENPNISRRLAIVLDGNLISAPHLLSEIPDGRATITGNFTFKEVQDLSIVLKAGALPAPIKIVQALVVDPMLGADSIASGKNATLIGCIAVMVFMAGYYFLPGMVANFALIWNVVLLPFALWVVGALLSMLDPSTVGGAISLPTLTLPGIAGIVLTVGMAVDANVLIYERIREEQHLGKDLKAVLSAGYHKAFSAIFDSHMTTIFSAFILFWLGSGAVRGFAVTLAAGIALSLYTSLVVTRMVFNLIENHTHLTRFRMLELFKNIPHINFIGAWKICAIISTVVIVGSWGVLLKRGKANLGVDFTGGTSLSFQFRQKVPVDKIRATVAAAGLKEAVIQYQRETKAGVTTREFLQVNAGFEESKKAVAAITANFQDAGFQLIREDSIGPKMSQELAQKSLLAIGIALLIMAIYVGFRFEFPYAIGAMASLFHDVLVALGVYCALGEQLNLNIVAAILTIIGYSINDTIVVFDRIRENVKVARGRSYQEIANEAINLSLGRTILTTGVTMLSVLALFIFGGGSLRDLTLCLLIGMTTGVYSTVYVATPFVLLFHREKKVVTA